MESVAGLKIGVAQSSRLVALAVVEETDEGYRVVGLERVRLEDATAAGERIHERFGGRYDRAYGAWTLAAVEVIPDALGVRPTFALSDAVGLPTREHAAPHLEELIEAGRLSFDVGDDEERAFWRQLRPGEDDLDAIAHDETIVAVALASGIIKTEY